jgi:diacylglycerol kinase (ATP)
MMNANPNPEAIAPITAPPSNTVLIANPRAGHGKGAKMIERARARLCAAGLDPEVRETTAPAHGTVLAAQARDADLVIALGGDGTLHEVVNGLFREGQPPRAALAILPAGTGNSFLRDFGIVSFEQALDRLISGTERRVDVGRFTCATPEGPRSGVFVNLIGAGFIADVCAVSQRKYKGMGAAGYVWGTLATLPALKAQMVRVTIDGVTEVRPLTMATLCNSRYTGGAMLVAPTAALDDGRLDLITAGPIGRAGLAALLPRLFQGGHLRHPAFAARLAATVTLDADPPLPLMIDGEPYGQTPLEVSMLPRALCLRI